MLEEMRKKGKPISPKMQQMADWLDSLEAGQAAGGQPGEVRPLFPADTRSTKWQWHIAVPCRWLRSQAASSGRMKTKSRRQQFPYCARADALMPHSHVLFCRILRWNNATLPSS
jgi:hypothetical protein